MRVGRKLRAATALFVVFVFCLALVVGGSPAWAEDSGTGSTSTDTTTETPPDPVTTTVPDEEPPTSTDTTATTLDDITSTTLGDTTSTTAPSTTTTTAKSVPAVTAAYDVVVYGSSTSGVGAIRALTLMRGVVLPTNATFALISSGNYYESTLANGLLVEDMFEPGVYASGLWKELRGNLGVGGNTRLKASSSDYLYWLKWRVNKPGVTFYAAGIQDVYPESKAITLRTTSGSTVTISGKVFIDASPTIDLARALGCRYRIGRDATVYGPGKTPVVTRKNSIPQSMSGLPTFRITGTVPQIWSTTTGRLDSGLCEFNEASSDYRVAQDLLDWVLEPAKRPGIAAKVRAHSAAQLYPGMTLVSTHPWPYFRGEVTIAYAKDGARLTGAMTLTRRNPTVSEPIALSYYNRYDRHAVGGNTSYGYAVVRVPWKIMMPREYDWLLVTEGGCVDYMAYNSSYRMEPLRMNVGGAAGTTAALAVGQGISPWEVSYQTLRSILMNRLGYKL